MNNVSNLLIKRLFITKSSSISPVYYFSQSANDRSKSLQYDIVVVGGGIIGVATARELSKRFSTLKLALVEKENQLAFHQSGHNSGVIHAGIYYKPGTLKAQLCVKGSQMLFKYLNAKNIAYNKCGKLIVSLNEKQHQELLNLYKRALENKCPDISLIEGKDIKKYESYCKGYSAIVSPHTAIVDFIKVTNSFAQDFTDNGGSIHLNCRVQNFTKSDSTGNSKSSIYPISIKNTKNQAIQAKYVLTCAGLYSDKISQLTGGNKNPKIVPFRGEYLLLSKEKSHMVKGNIYPVPDPRFPFLGVHFTPRMDGRIWLGPNAVLALKREGYSWKDINLAELLDALAYPGFIKLSSKYFTFGLKEMYKSIYMKSQLKQLQEFIPDLSIGDISRGPAGVRAQALDADGSLVDDFIFEQSDKNSSSEGRILNCRNAPSPGATSSLAIAEMIVDKFENTYFKH